tara:strand:- start:2264 stop:2743 length:480 start_codon:yes stop_codon:yes gene_type:complete
MLGNILGFIGIGLGIVSTFMGFSAAKDRSEALNRQAEQRNKVRELEMRKQAIRERREKFSLIREARIKRAAAVAAATVQGAQGSVRGGFGSIISQQSSGLQYINQAVSLTGQQNIFYNRAAMFATQARDAGTRMATWQGVGKMGSSIFQNRSDVEDLFS